MAIFDDPLEELKRLEEQLLQDEDDEEEYDEEYEEEYEDEEDEEEDEPAPPPIPARSNRGLILLVLLELAGIGLIAAYWLRVIL